MLDLPLKESPPPAMLASVGEDPLQVQPPGTLEGLTVLVVEDDDLSRAGLVGLLRSWGCEVLEARSQSEAVEQFSSHGLKVDVVLSDFRLPEGDDGLALVRQLRDLAQRNLPLALMSGDTAPQLMQQVRPAKLRSLLRHLSSTDWNASVPAQQDQAKPGD